MLVAPCPTSPGNCCERRRSVQRPTHIAVVDDDASTREALVRLLRAHGLEARSYASGCAFLNALLSDPPDCLVVDVVMPDMTGLELQRELLNRGFRIPTIIITAHDDEHGAVTAASLGAAAYLLKPLDRNTLLTAVDSAMNWRN